MTVRNIAPERPALGTTNILVGAPIGGDTWTQAGKICNWLNSRGAVLVPWCAPLAALDDEYLTQTFRFRVQPSLTAVRRIWLLDMEVEGSVTLTFNAPASTGTTVSEVAPAGRFIYVYTEELAAHSDTELEVSISVSSTIDFDSTVYGICCFEEDRATLANDTVDYGAVAISTRGNAPIYFGAAGSGQSYGGVIEAISNLDSRRVGILHWTAGESAETLTSASPAQLTTLGVPVLAQKLRRSDTTREVLWSHYGEMLAADTGTVNVSTSHSGVNDTLHVNWTADAWSAPRVIAIDCEDLTKPDGLRASFWDDMSLSHAGSGTTSIATKSVSVWTPKTAPFYIGGA